MSKFTVIDLFCGAGGLSKGFEMAGFEIIGGIDFDKDSIETFKRNHPAALALCEDITKLDPKKLLNPDEKSAVDIVIGGPPCQGFSMKGRRILKGSKDDPRNRLFREFMRVIETLMPKIAVMENVKGMLSMNDGKIKDEILCEFKRLGYNADFKVLNAADYGVAQLRERVFFIANRIGRKNIFPKKTHSPKNYVGVMKVLENVSESNHDPKKLSGKVLQRVKLIRPGQNWKSLPKELQTGSRQSGAYGRLDPSKPSMTLTTRFDTPPGGFVTHPTEDRAITVREGARIQSFPDDFIFLGNRMSQYRQVGNAVPVGLSNAVAKSVFKMLM